MLWLPDDEDDHQQASGDLTWYDARENRPNRTPEFRLYYHAAADSVIHNAAAGDLLVLALTTGGRAIIAIAPAGSTTERQLLWLFGLPDALEEATSKAADELDDVSVPTVALQILEALGIEVALEPSSCLDELVAKYGHAFPTTREMSAFARGCSDGDPVADPDTTLMNWYSTEESLFRGLERLIVEERLSQGFKDVDEFLSESLSLHQRRKSRAGYALENQVEAILEAHKVRYARGKISERRSQPDFIFPSIEEYRDPAFPETRLSMLAAKSTCKERWRQILPEADRIEEKHLLTLEPAISAGQTTEMATNRVRLVLPHDLHATYLESQRPYLMTVHEFIELVNARAAVI